MVINHHSADINEKIEGVNEHLFYNNPGREAKIH